jgi:hypothetical protein
MTESPADRSPPDEVELLRVDLALKDAYALELSGALADAEQRLAAQEAEVARLRAAVVQAEVRLEEATTRTGYGLLVRASDLLNRHPRVRQVMAGLASTVRPR